MLRWILACVAAMQPPAAGVDASTIDLQWDAPVSCPSAADMRARIAALAASVPAAARVHVVAEAEGFRAHVELRREAGPDLRSLSAPTCAAVAEAAALVIAISPERGSDAPPPALEPPVLLPAPEPAPPLGPVAEAHRDATPRGAPVPDEPPPPARSATQGLRIGVLLDAGITWRTVPGVAPTIAGGLALIGPDWRVELRAVGTTRVAEQLASPAFYAVTAEVRSAVGQLRAAWVPRVRIVEVPLTGGVELGAQRASAKGGTNNEVGTALLVALTAGAGLAIVPVPWLAIRAELAAVLALARPRFAVGTPPMGEVTLEAPWLGLRALAGVELRLDPRRRRARSRSR